MTNHYSASQIATHRDCERKWWWRYVRKIQAPQNRFAALGSEVHRRLQPYLEKGELPHGNAVALEIGDRRWTEDDMMAIMLPGIQHLPVPGVAQCEHEIRLDIGALGEIVGYVDFWYAENGIAIVGDHKTTSGLQWALSPSDLKSNPQSIIYSVAAMEEFDVEVAECHWVYYCTQKPKSKLVTCGFSLTELQPLWQGLLCEIEEMNSLREVENVADIGPTIEACTKYGGCPYQKECNLGSRERMKGLFSMASLRDKMKAAAVNSKPIEAAPKIAAAPSIPADPVNPPESAGPKAKLLAMKAKMAQASVEGAPVNRTVSATIIDDPAPATPVTPERGAPFDEVLPPIQATPATPSIPSGLRKSKSISMLCIDCAPDGEFLSFGDLVAPVVDSIKVEHGYHYKLIPNLYGGNGALFAEALDEHLAEMAGSLPVVVSSANPMVQDALAVLERRAVTVVRGLK